MGTMRTQLSFANLSGIETELLAVLAADTQTAKGPDAKPQPVLLTADAAVQAAAAAVLASGEYKAGANETLLLHAPAGLAAKRLLIVGLGKQAKATAHAVRNAAGTAVRFAKPRGIRELVFALPELRNLACRPATCARAAVEGAFVGDFDPDTYRSDRKDQSVQSFTLAAPARRGQGGPGSRLCRGRDRGREPELHPLAGQRAGQQADADHPGPARRGDGRRSRPGLRRSTPPKSCTS